MGKLQSETIRIEDKMVVYDIYWTNWEGLRYDAKRHHAHIAKLKDAYNADSLEDNVKTFDRYLQKYEEVYTRAGIHINHFADVDAFVSHYLSE